MNPLSAIFGMGVRLRNALYDRELLQIRRLSRPVVSVGNISVGGSGKTPFVIMLGGLLQERGIEFDVLSRGYGRKSKDVATVDPAGLPEQFGDEPLLMARKLGVPVIVGADRYRAGLLAEQKFPKSRLHLLDDGFQHRRLHRDFDIVLVPDEDLGEPLLPWGRLREPFSALRRADAVVLSAASSIPLRARLIWRIRRNIQFLVPMSRVIAFCGIARPEQFFSGLRKLGMELAASIPFFDHHRYTQRDIDRLLRAKAQTGAKGFITTDKDAVNLGPLAAQLRTFETAGLELELEDAQTAVEALLSTLEQRNNAADFGCKPPA
jgi:tetraacyldisaccharide 4'-kinase